MQAECQENMFAFTLTEGLQPQQISSWWFPLSMPLRRVHRKKKKANLMQEEGTGFAKHNPEGRSLEAQAVFMGLGLDCTACSATGKGCGLRFLLAYLVIKQPIKSETPMRGFHLFQLDPICALFLQLASSQVC